MGDRAIQIHESDFGNRYLIPEGADVQKVRKIASLVIMSSQEPMTVFDQLTRAVHSFRLNRLIEVTMGDYEDEEASYRPASGLDLAQLVLTGTENIKDI